MNKKYLVIIPAYNEEKNIVQVLKGIKRYAPTIDVIVIDDCSRDNTRGVVKEEGFNIISLCSNLGYSGAISTGYKYASSHCYDYVIQFDADGQHDPRDIVKLINYMEKNDFDIVIGSRFLNHSDYGHGFVRSIGTKLFSIIIKIITGKRITDPTSGLQILNRKAYTYYSISGNFPEYPDANILILMARLGFSIGELQVTMHERLSGVGMHEHPIKNVKYIISMFYSIFISTLKERKIG